MKKVGYAGWGAGRSRRKGEAKDEKLGQLYFVEGFFFFFLVFWYGMVEDTSLNVFSDVRHCPVVEMVGGQAVDGMGYS